MSLFLTEVGDACLSPVQPRIELGILNRGPPVAAFCRNPAPTHSRWAKEVPWVTVRFTWRRRPLAWSPPPRRQIERPDERIPSCHSTFVRLWLEFYAAAQWVAFSRNLTGVDGGTVEYVNILSRPDYMGITRCATFCGGVFTKPPSIWVVLSAFDYKFTGAGGSVPRLKVTIGEVSADGFEWVLPRGGASVCWTRRDIRGFRLRVIVNRW